MSALNLDADRRQDLERELAGVIRDFEIVDRDLVVGDSLSIDWLGFDGEGALVLVLWTAGEGGRVVLDLLDALAFVRTHLDVLARHWHLAAPEAPGADGGPVPIDDTAHTPVRAVCLAEHFDTEALQRLSVWGSAELDLFEVRTVRSERGEGAYLVPARGPAGEPGAAAVRASFFDGVPEQFHVLGRAFIERMSRVDEGVKLVEGEGAADWFYRGQRLGALRAGEVRLEASLAGSTTPQGVLGEGDVDDFVDRVLARLVELSDDLTGDDDDLAEIDDGDELEQVELIPMDSEPLLTPEEIAAFHD
ncbi:MAG: hypothetical protein ACI80N_002629 [Gammaproteobacteria bacterium]|jgi:hypothetical protein